MNDPEHALELAGVTRSWPGGPPVFANLDLTLPRGRVCCLLGPSGCGKTTLLRCAASLEAPQSGVVRVDGRVMTGPTPGRQLILQDDRQLFPWLTVARNVGFPRHPLRGDPGRADVRQVLDMVGLADAAGLYPAQLSGGMKQRAVLARALMSGPSILLMDEPFGALDTEIRGRLHRLVLDICRERTLTVLLVTHDIAEALVLADTITCMDVRGRLRPAMPNPLGSSRDPADQRFPDAWRDLRGLYHSLLEPEDTDVPLRTVHKGNDAHRIFRKNRRRDRHSPAFGDSDE